MKKDEEKDSVSSFIGIMELLNNMKIGEKQRFIANNQEFVIVKTNEL